MSDNGIINIHGKQYKTVALRVTEFCKLHEGWSIETDLVGGGEMVIMKATVRDDQGRARGTGYAEEVRGSTNINKTSAVENCETSAIGRALACIGLAGTEYASANEVTDAILQQKVMEAVKPLIDHNNAARELVTSISAIKEGIATGDLASACEEWVGLTEEEKKSIWVAPTKGGLFTTNEREVMKSSEFRQAFGYAEVQESDNQ